RLGGDLDPANRAGLQKQGVRAGDVVEGVVEGGKPRRLRSARAFYETVWDLPPGGKVTLRVRDRGDVTLRVGQGIDERKPLFSLFVAAAAEVRAASAGGGPVGVKAEDRAWIGWNPNGPYDAGDAADAEQYVGWHQNTGKPETPVSFRPARAYRKEYRRE